MSDIPAKEIWEMVTKCIELPFPQICRHLVALDLLCLLEKYGHSVPDNLAAAIVKCHDDEALQILNEKKL